MPYDIKVKTNSLLETSSGTNAQIEMTGISLMKSKLPRVEGRADGSDDTAMEDLVGQNLIYTGNEAIFNGKFANNFIENSSITSLFS
jgi:hypothetical protein